MLLQNTAEGYKMHQVFYYKMRTLLQNAMFITNCDSTLTQLQKRYRDIHKTYQMNNSVAEKLKKKPIEMTLIMNFKISVTLLQGKSKRWH